MASTPHPNDRIALHRSSQFLRMEFALSVLATATAVGLQISLGGNGLGFVVIVAFAATATAMWWGQRRLDDTNIVQTVLFATAVLWVSTLTIAPLIPFGLPIMSFPMIIPLLIAGPLLDRRQLVWFVVAAGLASGCVALLALGAGTTSLQQLIPEQTRDAIIVSTFGIRAVTISLVAWDASERRDATLAAAAQARDALRASRARLVTAGDDQRKVIERNLHDGAQQHVVALSMRLRMMSARHTELSDEVAPLVEQAQAALDELREVAHGIYPPLLERSGLSGALPAVARRQPTEVTVETNGVGRFAADVEAAIYYSCVEALQNASKYAGDDAVVSVTLTETAVEARDRHYRELRVEVRDNGVGFATATQPVGRGLQNIVDRLDAIGGAAEITSSPGVGTSVVLTLRVPVEDLVRK